MNINKVTNGGEACVRDHKVVSSEEWVEARKAFLKKEKELTRQKDQLDAERRELPWRKVEKDYVFEGADGKVTLAELFQGRSQLFIYHFMFGPDWEEGCTGCSFLSDHLDGANWHLPHADVALAVISRARYAKLAQFKEKMGWKFNWVSSYGSDFNFDYHVSFTPEELADGKVMYNYELTSGEPGDEGFDELPGSSVFYKNAQGEIFHTYSNYSRGGESIIGTFSILDFVPKGRNEEAGIMNWVRRHTEYTDQPEQSECCGCDASKVDLPAPKIEHVDEINLAGLREHFTAQTAAKIPELWHRLDPLFGKIEGQQGKIAFGVCYQHDETGFDYMAAVPVETLTGLTGGSLTGATLPASDYAKFPHHCSLQELKNTFGAIMEKWLPTAGRQPAKGAPWLEFYPEDFHPVNNPKGVEVWVPLK